MPMSAPFPQCRPGFDSGLQESEGRYNEPVKWLSLIPLVPLLAGITFPPEASDRQARFLNFSVKQKSGIYVRDLKQEEVKLHLDQEPVEIRYFGYQNVDTAFAIIVENSPRTARYNVSRPHYGEVNIIDIVRYYLVDEIIPAVAELGEVWIGQFYQELETVHDFTDQDWELIQSIHDMKPRPRGLDLENIPVGRFLGRGVDILRTRSEKRKVLMLVTATADRESLKNLDEYRDMLRITDIDLYVVSFGPRVTSPGSSSPARFNPYYFRQLVSETGGKFYLSGEYVFPSEFMNDLITTLSNSYTIGFYVHPGSPPSTRSVQLEVAREKIKIQHRKTLVF